MGWIGDAIQIAMGADTFWKGLALILLAYFGWRLHLGLKEVLEQLAQTSIALRAKNGQTISIKDELEGLEQGVVGEVSELEEALKSIAECQETCLQGREACAAALRGIMEKPYQLCEKFLNCPANKAKVDQYQRLEDLIMRKWASDDAAMKDLHERMKHQESLTLANREIFQTFTGELGKEVLRSLRWQAKERE